MDNYAEDEIISVIFYVDYRFLKDITNIY